jgi:hypothetical protein
MELEQIKNMVGDPHNKIGETRWAQPPRDTAKAARRRLIGRDKI